MPICAGENALLRVQVLLAQPRVAIDQALELAQHAHLGPMAALAQADRLEMLMVTRQKTKILTLLAITLKTNPVQQIQDMLHA